MGQLSTGKDVQGLVKLCVLQGWQVSRTRRGHLRLVSPSGVIVIGPGRAGEWRAVANFRASLRRAGADV
jgi:predicted RNA binding protein YcfA (HicA-like mRNA interferase family)